MTTEVIKAVVRWDDLDGMIRKLADELRPGDYDPMLAITRGGLVPAGMLAYRLGIRNILVAAVEFYDDEGRPGPKPTFLQFPADPLLRGQRILIVDEVWDSGTTITPSRSACARPAASRRPLSSTSSPAGRTSPARRTITPRRRRIGSSIRSRRVADDR